MKGDEGSVRVVDDNEEVNRDLLARRLQRQGQPILDLRFWILDLLYPEVSSLEILDFRFTIGEDNLSQPFNSLLRAAAIDSDLAKQRLRNRQQADLQKLTEEQEKSERLLGKEETNG